MNELFSFYTTDRISGLMSLRKPQAKSLEILEQIVTAVPLKKEMDLSAALKSVNAMFPTCTDFERDFMSLTFALATGVGKTRLMGAFIAYLYTQHNIRNFLVVAPNTTIYEKLQKDLSDTASPKYVFKGLGCFANAPQIITDDDYKNKTVSFYESELHIYIYNIDKFNKENAAMKRPAEALGTSFYDALANLPDLVLIMDESHHYRAERGAQSLNDLHPVLGLELTATPLVAKGAKQVPFKNVVYEYNLASAIADGYTRTPFAVTRSDIDFFQFGDEQLDKLMLLDGIECHEHAKQSLAVYAHNNNKPVVKPFMLVVCKDTEHAAQVEAFIRSDDFKGGAYRNKTIVVHSKQKGAESEANMRLLLDVERAENPVEIVIHVNMLKEGWDVNNLYTIVPLRTATSKILREQMIGRGLRLPYGARTGDRDVDAVMLTAHDKFKEIIEEAQRGDSIFKAGNVIRVEELQQEHEECAQLTMLTEPDEVVEKAYALTQLERTEENDRFFRASSEFIRTEVSQYLQDHPSQKDVQEHQRKVIEKVKAKIEEDRDLGAVFYENRSALEAWMLSQQEETLKEIKSRFILIPRLSITEGEEDDNYGFDDFEIDLSAFTHKPVQNDILEQNLTDMHDWQRKKGSMITFEGREPKKELIKQLRTIPEIDYERCSKLLQMLVVQVCDAYTYQYGVSGMQNIVMMHKRDIADKIYAQMKKHQHYKEGFLCGEIAGINDRNLQPQYTFQERVDLYAEYSCDITQVLFYGIRRGVFDCAKFDSDPELQFARVLDHNPDVKKWLRPARDEFNINYRGSSDNTSHKYEPDFVVETADMIYLAEVKSAKEMNAPDVLAKKDSSVQYCKAATQWSTANGYKPWRYLLIPDNGFATNSTFQYLAEQFWVTD